ncbi:MAG: SCO family protein [Proteobacteria bacterium]|nr:SCO family protein [Pseudomonadota bacterium]
MKWMAGFAAVVALSGLLVYPPLAQSIDENSLPGNSVYHLQVSVEDQLGEMTGLDRYRGKPVLITMFYASCPHVCPMLISTIMQTEARLSTEELAELRVLTISIDPERDTPDKLLETLERHSADSSRWSLVRPEPGDVRTIAGVFGIKYKQLPDGEFNHTTKIILLDREGVQVASTSQLGHYDPAFLEAIKKSLQ